MISSDGRAYRRTGLPHNAMNILVIAADDPADNQRVNVDVAGEVRETH